MVNERQIGKTFADKILRKYMLLKPTLDELVYIASESGYEIIDYSQTDNLDGILTLAERLSIQSYIEAGTAFTYNNNETKLIFLCETMTNDEKLYALAHELGHIFCEHFNINSKTVNSIKEEREANEFAHYLLDPSICTKTAVLLMKYKKALTVGVLALLVIIAIFSIWNYAANKKPYSIEYYKTTSGEKYHEKDCFIIKDKNNIERLTEKEYNSGEYGPCQICLP